jgi:hypothetical protein
MFACKPVGTTSVSCCRRISSVCLAEMPASSVPSAQRSATFRSLQLSNCRGHPIHITRDSNRTLKRRERRAPRQRSLLVDFTPSMTSSAALNVAAL